VIFAGFPIEERMPLTFHRAMVSYVGRMRVATAKEPVQCLQLDGSVNLGNSGGPVINRAGEVVGVVSVRFGELTENLRWFQISEENALEWRGMLQRMIGEGRALVASFGQPPHQLRDFPASRGLPMYQAYSAEEDWLRRKEEQDHEEGHRKLEQDAQEIRGLILEIAKMLSQYTNVGIGWAVSCEYLKRPIDRLRQTS
jgi:hypothetical protein